MHISKSRTDMDPKLENVTKVLWTAGSVLFLTIIHHIYGAIIYETPFRLHITYYAIPVLLLLVLVYSIYRHNPSALAGRISLWAFVITAFLIPVVLFGFIEGGYNHLIKNMVYFSGASDSTLDRLFPPPTYEMPDDFWFEATGILQFFVGFFAAVYLKKVVWDKKTSA